MYEGVFSPIPDPGAYLARIGLEPDDYRKSLHQSFQTHLLNSALRTARQRWMCLSVRI